MLKYLCLVFMPWACFADSELQVKYGLGISRSAMNSPVEVKVFSIAHKHPLVSILNGKIEGGLWTDTTGGGRKGSEFGSYSLGLDVLPGVVYSQIYLGVAGITNTDSYLGGHFQFVHDVSLGFRDGERRSIGVNYKHISSAGIYSPNVGRDFLMIKVDIPF